MESFKKTKKHSEERLHKNKSSSNHRRKEKHRHRHRSNSSNSSRDGSDLLPSSESKALVLSKQEIEILKEEKQREKEQRKAMETPEEKRARRLAKKMAKGRKTKVMMGWDEEYLGYTNADNPFGDEHLLDTFVWKKKLEKEGKKDVDVEEIEKEQKLKMVLNKRELEKVKQRRLERERERAEKEMEHELLQREKEAQYFRQWEKQEDSFHLQQAKLRSKKRIEDGRAKPIDLLAQYICAEDDDLAIEMHEPYTFLNGLTIADLEDLLEDIKVYIELEEGKNVDYWRDITIIVDEELDKLRKLDPLSREYIGDRRSGINPSVVEDISKVFKGKTLSQLLLFEEQIKNKLKGGEGIDIGYWESLLQQLKAFMARQRLRERHEDQLRRKLFKLKQEQCIVSNPLFPIVKDEKENDDKIGSHGNQNLDVNNTNDDTNDDIKLPTHTEENLPSTSKDTYDKTNQNQIELIEEEYDNEEKYEQEYESGRYSPVFVQPEALPPITIIVDEGDDHLRLKHARKLVVTTGEAEKDIDDDLLKRARAGMNEEEAQFSVEVPLVPQASVWSDKYRPRKPRFFNRVHTGFEWNKYNQTHYDVDNPPPKIVQGYKFNIFYPDLIDKTKTPSYRVTPCEDNPEFGCLRFHAGAPYEDIAFKVVHREWEHSYRHGFRCQFQNNIFQLWFHFKRYRYRR